MTVLSDIFAAADSNNITVIYEHCHIMKLKQADGQNNGPEEMTKAKVIMKILFII